MKSDTQPTQGSELPEEDWMADPTGTPPTTPIDDPAPGPSTTSLPSGCDKEELPPYVSPTLTAIPIQARPARSTVCEICPASVWFASEGGLKAFCRVMHLVTWSNEDPNALTHCDGQVMAELERQLQADG